MLLTVFTPTHNPRYLSRLERSLFEQTYQNYEWIIVPNGGVTFDDLSFLRSPKVRLISYDGPSGVIGRLKKHACTNASGQVLIEVDHDDVLTPDALETIAEAFSDPEVDFAYSNCAEIRDGKPYVYSSVYGWKWRPFRYKAQELLELIAFPLNPVSLCRIWFAPNHVRAWRKSFYDKIGGHNTSMAYLDDQDILCRSYIAGNGKHIDRCLYIYHYHSDNSCQTIYNANIQEETWNLYEKYLDAMIDKWCRINSLRKIDLCGQFNKPVGYESIDIANADIIADLNKHWPIESGTVGVIRAHDALEHLRDPIHVMKEVYRCLAPYGWLRSMTPSTDGRGAFQDPTHVSFWNMNSFWYYTRSAQARFIGTPVKFQAVRVRNLFPSAWHRENNIIYVQADLVKPGPHTPGLWEFIDA